MAAAGEGRREEAPSDTGVFGTTQGGSAHPRQGAGFGQPMKVLELVGTMTFGCLVRLRSWAP